ncbi:response regulator transcription factor [Limnohabitans sp. 15K]|uniref:response regulator transcription factor n=1 Tax=Limnohabitans sp. 15K TaxID=1100706 RepID=UPI0013044329|nr:response regulator [Limnohabitans sp. 15K]
MRPFKVTVLCDSPAQRDLDVAALHQNGYEATGMASAATLDICGPDVVLINLTGMDGDPFALVETVVKTSPQVGVLLVISADEDDKTRAYQSGADNYLVRPYEPGELVAVVKSLSRRLQRTLNV